MTEALSCGGGGVLENFPSIADKFQGTRQECSNLTCIRNADGQSMASGSYDGTAQDLKP